MILREVVVKITQLLAGMGLQVTQRGTKAFVGTNKRTHKPEVVNIPYLPDNASKELILAIQGFIDHEVAHILETDFSVHAAIDEVAKDYPHLRAIWNTLEDTFIERQDGSPVRRLGLQPRAAPRVLPLRHHDARCCAALAKATSTPRSRRCSFRPSAPTPASACSRTSSRPAPSTRHPELGPQVGAHRAVRRPRADPQEHLGLLRARQGDQRGPQGAAAPSPASAARACPSPPPPSEDEAEPENEPQGANGGEGVMPEDEGKGPAEDPQDEQSEDEQGRRRQAVRGRRRRRVRGRGRQRGGPGRGC